MSLQTSRASLERQHEALEREIEEERAHPGADQLRLSELKRRKLLLKDEIERLRLQDGVTVH
jgi:hypothetical protein